MLQPAMKIHAFGRAVSLHPYASFWEPLADDPGFELRPMFGGKAAYLDGRLALYFTAKEEPWRGVLACTDRERQPALLKDFPELIPHPVLPKWLYLSEESERFERVATALVALARRRDARLGVESSRRRSRAKAGSRERFRPGRIAVRTSGGRERWLEEGPLEAAREAVRASLGAPVRHLGRSELLSSAAERLAGSAKLGAARARWWARVALEELESRGEIVGDARSLRLRPKAKRVPRRPKEP